MTDNSFIYTPSIRDPTHRDVQHSSELFDVDPSFLQDFPSEEPLPATSAGTFREFATGALLAQYQNSFSPGAIAQENSPAPSGAWVWQPMNPENVGSTPFNSYMPDRNPWTNSVSSLYDVEKNLRRLKLLGSSFSIRSPIRAPSPFKTPDFFNLAIHLFHAPTPVRIESNMRTTPRLRSI
jgi:hypothetical protein